MNKREKKKICVVEDDRALREACALSLKSKGFDVFTAVDGEEGLKLIREINPDLIILDLLMPKKSGYEVLDELRDEKELSSIPVIVFTNLDDHESAEKAGQFETRFYLVKALTSLEKLEQIVREVLH